MKLAVVLNRESNNFDFLRLVAALTVIFGHAYAIAPIDSIGDPVLNLIGFDRSGSVAVKFFFFLSGLVVTNSLLKKENAASFIISRTLRVFPGLIVCVLFSVLLGAFLSSMDFREYFFSNETKSYLNNNILLQEIKWTLPGVFQKTRLIQ
jgi:peptidoglycan/LPS O-acetylase OafA/YrhL